MPAFAATNTTAQTSATEQRYARDIVIDGTVVRPYQSHTFDEFTPDILAAMDEDTVSVVHHNGPFSLDDLPKIGLTLVRSVGLVRVYGIQGQTHIEQTILSVVPADAGDEDEAEAAETPEPAAAEKVTDEPEPAANVAQAEPADMVADEIDDEPADEPEVTPDDAPEEPAEDAPSEPDAPEIIPAGTPDLASKGWAADLHWRTVVGIIEKAPSKESLAGFLAEDEARVAVLKAYAARFPA